MATVSMTIKEYNDLRDEMLLYKKALEELLTPSIDKWDLEWYKEHPTADLSLRSKSLHDLSFETRQIISQIFYRKENEYLGDLGEYVDEGVFMSLGHFSHFPEPSEEGEDE